MDLLEALMHPLSHRWRIAAAVIPVILLTACGRDATPVSPDQSQRAVRDILSDGPLAYNIIGELELQVGQQSQLKTRNSRNVRGATWTSSNPAVASVNTNGVVAGVATGESFVTLSGFGVSETYRVGVTPTPTVTDLSISPATGTALAPGQSRQFTRSVTWSDGATRAATVTYSVSNAGAGTINSNGLFTAGQLAGTFSIIASCACGGVTPLADTAQVVIASLSSLAISPRTVTVAPGGTQAFSASALWSNGATLLPGVTYSTPSSAEGTVTNPGGLYTAPTTPGTYRVILAQVGGPARDTAIVTVPAPQLTTLTISPKTVSLVAGATQQFSASANWSTGATTLPPVSYSMVGGGSAVTVAGLFTAPVAAGTYRVVVAHTGGTLRDTATVTVTAPAATLTGLTISPRTSTLSTGGTRQFSASATWSNGSTTLPAVTYSVVGSGSGSVTTAGLYTAPGTAGTYRVVVAHTGGTRRDTATVTVSSGTSSTAPAPPTGNANVLFFDDFESGGFTKVQNGIRWTGDSWVDASTMFPRNGSRSARFRQGDSKSGGELRFGGLPNLPEVFIQFWLYQPNGSESPSVGPAVTVPLPGGNDKFFRLWSGTYAESTVKYGASTWGTNGVGLIGSEFTRNAGDRMLGMGEGGTPFRQNPKLPAIGAPQYRGSWVRVRIRARVASAANNDGILQVWFNDDNLINKTNLPSYAWNGVGNFFQSGYLLGWANSGFNPGTNMFIDDVTISTGNFPGS